MAIDALYYQLSTFFKVVEFGLRHNHSFSSASQLCCISFQQPSHEVLDDNRRLLHFVCILQDLLLEVNDRALVSPSVSSATLVIQRDIIRRLQKENGDMYQELIKYRDNSVTRNSVCFFAIFLKTCLLSFFYYISL